MRIIEAIQLIKNDFPIGKTPETWADLGAGSGTFTEALASFLPDGSVIYAVDKVQEMQQASGSRLEIRFVKADFEKDSLPLPPLDCILMANSLHYVFDKKSLLQKLRGNLKPGGRIVVVEYDTDKPNAWVPFPITAEGLKALFPSQGFTQLTDLGRRSSIYGQGDLYAISITLTD
jgi:ubiquinone/menaquinone biosynthesis C-methylase UbiE